MIATLRQRNFGLLWFAGLTSVSGDWVLNVGLPIYVYLLTHSVLATSLTLMAALVPHIALGSVAGVFVDRWDRKRTMVVTNLLLAIALLPLLLVRTADHVWIVYLVLFLEACLEQFFTPAQQSLLPLLVGEEHLVPANSLNSLSSNTARLVGPALGGLIAATFGLTGIVLADAASFLAGALLVALIAVTSKSARAQETTPTTGMEVELGALAGVWREWIDGLRVMGSERILMVLLSAFAIAALGEGVFGALFPVFVNQVLHGQAVQIGELMSAQAVGGLLGGLLVGWVGQRVLSRWVIGLGQVAFGILDLLIFNSPAVFPFFWLSFGLFIAVGVPGLASSTGEQSLLQMQAPEAYRGRIFGALGTTMGLFMLIGTIIAATVTEQLGVVPLLNLQGSAYILVGLLLLTMLPPRAKDAPSEVSADAEPIATPSTP